MRPVDGRHAGWTALTLGSLLLGVIALTAGSGPGGPEAPASRLVVSLPPWLTTVAGVAGSLALLLFFALITAVSRRRRKIETGRAGLVGSVLVPLILALLLASNQGLLERLRLDDPGRPAAALPAEDAERSRDLPPVAVPFFTVAVGVLVLAATLGALGLLCWLIFGERIGRWWSESLLAARSPLADAVDESLEDLRQEADARAAIIRCYGRFERVLARSRVPRRPWQTPTEYMRGALLRLPLPAEPVRQLTGLFEVARFSDQPLGERERDAAWDALRSIRASLEPDAEPGTPGDRPATAGAREDHAAGR
jgi:hypothetical protein